MDPNEANWDEILPILLAGPLQSAGAERVQRAWENVAARVTQLTEIALRRYRVEWLEAGDVAQDVLLKLQDSAVLRRLSAARSVDGYLVVSIRNVVFDRIRRRRAEAQLVRDGSWLERAPVVSPEDRVALRMVLDRLTDEERELLRLRFWEGRSIQEIAGTLGIRYSAASVRLFRLLRKLRDALDEPS